MATKRSKPVATKANEAQVAGLIAKIFGSPGPRETIDDVMGELCDSFEMSFPRDVDGLYPWLADVAKQVMSGQGDLVEHLTALTDPVLVVRDTQRSGVDSIWLVAASLVGRSCSLDYDQFRGLFNHVRVGEEVIKITAVQLNSWRTKSN
jgi:hypothetical protein